MDPDGHLQTHLGAPDPLDLEHAFERMVAHRSRPMFVTAPLSTIPEVDPKTTEAVVEMCDAYMVVRKRHTDLVHLIDEIESQVRCVELARSTIVGALHTIVCPSGSDNSSNAGVHSITSEKETRLKDVMALVDALVREQIMDRDVSALRIECEHASAFLTSCRKVFECSKDAILRMPVTLAMDDDTHQTPTCTICCTRRIDTAMAPCGHTFCSVCASRVLDTRVACPVCRVPTTRLQQLFFP